MSAKILIVEDSPSMRKLVRDALESGGYEVWESSDGREGLQVLPEVRPDLIITDVNMPELDGINMVREIRAQYVTLAEYVKETTRLKSELHDLRDQVEKSREQARRKFGK